MMNWEEEEGMLDHYSHKHPLCLVEPIEYTFRCHGCIRIDRSYIGKGERVYKCIKRCGSELHFHKECAEIPRRIKHHPLHPQHTLIQQYYHFNPHSHLDLDSNSDSGSDVFVSCSSCKKNIRESVSYSCTSSECPEFRIHSRCAQARGVMDADEEEEAVVIHHPSHPEHQLRFLNRRAGGSHSFKCDACGTRRRDNSYLCTICSQFWIHQECASLPYTVSTTYHSHTLSLSFFLPLEYILSDSVCDICHTKFIPKYWIYHCQQCRYVVHVKCAFKKVYARYPIIDVVKEQITPFVTTSVSVMPDKILNFKYEVPFHKHKLGLVSSPTSSELICDGCITPILSDEDMMSCSECKYILHWACSQFPPKLPSLHLHNMPHDHELVLQSCSKLEFGAKCKVCRLYTNGLMYACTACDFKADIKCASLPDSIYHKSHDTGHLLTYFSKKETMEFSRTIYSLWCDGCDLHFKYLDCYKCATCDFVVHVRCAVLPPETTNRVWDKHHPLKLTYCEKKLYMPREDCSYCDHCEEEMDLNSKSWVYRCKPCDLTFHPRCFPDVAGYYRNIKFGHKYTIASAHTDHPLAYQFLTIKRRCDVCRRDAYLQRGFQCDPCNFFICLHRCAQQRLQDIQILDS